MHVLPLQCTALHVCMCAMGGRYAGVCNYVGEEYIPPPREFVHPHMNTCRSYISAHIRVCMWMFAHLDNFPNWAFKKKKGLFKKIRKTIILPLPNCSLVIYLLFSRPFLRLSSALFFNVRRFFGEMVRILHFGGKFLCTFLCPFLYLRVLHPFEGPSRRPGGGTPLPLTEKPRRDNLTKLLTFPSRVRRD